MDKKITYIANPSQGVHFHRLETPMRLMAKDYKITEVDLIDLDTDADVVIFNRLPNQPLSVIEKLKAKGKRIIMDIDDYWTRPIWHGNRMEGYEHQYTIEILKALKMADVVWVSTPYLQERIALLQIDSVLIPNAIDYADPQFIRGEIKRDKLVAGWIGQNNHHIDFQLLSKAEIWKNNKIEYAIGGVNEINDYWLYLAGCFGGKVKMFEGETMDKYGYLYNELDIVILPSVAKDYFSSSKSNLKILEASAHSLPVITNGGLYREINGRNGMRIKDNWNKALSKMIKSKAMREDYGIMLNDWARNKYDIHKINEIRKQTI